jgi:hypothetical protein
MNGALDRAPKLVYSHCFGRKIEVYPTPPTLFRSTNFLQHFPLVDCLLQP